MEDKLVIGIPKAMLYHRYGWLWKVFFKQLDVKLIYSPMTNKMIMDKGSSLAIDEACLSLKIYLGHVATLIGKCDYILVPRIYSFGLFEDMCPRFSALYDVCRNVFKDTNQKFIAYNIDSDYKIDEKKAMIDMAIKLGFSVKQAKHAYKEAKAFENKRWKDLVKEEEKKYKSKATKILVAGHSYIVDDPYIGTGIMDYLASQDVCAIRGDIVNRDDAIKESKKLSKTCKWVINKELLGSIEMHKEHIDGIILISAFPCGPDAMTNEIVIRKIKDIPILNLVVDGQSGIAGVETRLESFVDIIRFKRGEL